ncbi:HAD-IA family hydrolase [Longimicrobium terrae]|uniref:HAD superfamily hydrolase (TIGR01509 family) n=1 Tax=Longimicrobium terrae TaxID=1639882 RepID=A0A841GXW9_9BACT|nr:HAD superfamily hydrolase (TIGR01509 family) [Longimicrobium terrae]MBB6070592.1 HAD superfamily hydrolase (TIGR01509 family) [Longimicrobium terrae]NNC29576.1 HAD family hydrolase [Longimicrobium terrae]
MSGLKAVLLDIDGTLMDSNDEHAHAWVDALAEFGHTVEYGRVRRMIGMGGDKVLPELTGIEEDTDEGTRIKDRRGEIFRERYLPTLKPFPHAADLLRRFGDEGLTLVVATSASKTDMKGLLKQGGLEKLMDEKTSSSDADASKPDPDIVQAALKRGGCEPGEALMLGDTPYDIEAANKAGVRCIALTCGGWREDELKDAVAVYRDPADLLARFDESPFARG